MKCIRILLFPIVPFYYGVTWLRNVLYDLGIKTAKTYNFPTICVGNISAGGTGKTPMVEYLIRLLKTDFNVATLSRGYGRRTKGFILASHRSSAETIGDEPFQFFTKFKDTIQVAVDENRQRGISKLRALKNQPTLIVLDDAFQHRKVAAKLNILLSTYSNLYCNDMVLPTGNLREPRQGARRAQIIIVTKCPKHLSSEQKNSIVAKLKPKAFQEVFFSSISYACKVIGYANSLTLNELKEFTLVTGIANAKPLVDFLEMKGLHFKHLKFSDHHVFSKNDINTIAKHKLIITTEKDYVRLITKDRLIKNLYYLPISITIDRSTDFKTLLMSKIKA